MSSLFPIHHVFGPMVSRSQVLWALKLLCMPWVWKNGRCTTTFRIQLQEVYHRDAFLFATGREALLAFLQTLELEEGDEVILQAYTCAVVPNAIRAAGGIPIYADINPGTLNLDPVAAEQCISSKTRAIICQHTFGIPGPTKELKQLCREHDLALIEDCAHILPDDDVHIGQYSDAIFCSFGRDKAVSGVTGGAILTQHAHVAQKLRHMESEAIHLPVRIIAILLCYPIHYTFAKMVWLKGLGKAYLYLLGKLGLLRPILTLQEKHGITDSTLHAMPNACACLAWQQWKQRNEINAHRKKLLALYKDQADTRHWTYPAAILRSPAPLKFPVLTMHAEKIQLKLKPQQIYLDDGWQRAIVNPPATDQESMGYTPGSCPNAERITKQLFSLPTHPTMTTEQAHVLLKHLEKCTL